VYSSRRLKKLRWLALYSKRRDPGVTLDFDGMSLQAQYKKARSVPVARMQVAPPAHAHISTPRLHRDMGDL
jgi:hypothetical protein